jgi:glutamate synthase domain-containing protein 3
VITLDCQDLGVTQVNREIRSLPDGSEVVITEPRGAHNIGVGLMRHLKLTVEGNTGYYLGGLCDGPDIVVNGSVGWGVGENLMSGTIVVNGNASESVGATAHGGLIVINGDASLRAGISLKGGTIAVAGSVGNMSAFMAQAGTILVGGYAGDSLGDSLYEAVVYVAGKVGSLGADAQIEELTEDDVRTVRDVAAAAGFDHVDPANVTKVGSAKQLYNFDALKNQRY